VTQHNLEFMPGSLFLGGKSAADQGRDTECGEKTGRGADAIEPDGVAYASEVERFRLESAEALQCVLVAAERLKIA